MLVPREIIMAEGTPGPGIEGSSVPPAVARREGQSLNQPIAANRSEQALSQPPTLRERISQIPVKERWRIAADLPRSEIGPVFKILGLEIKGGAPTYLEEAAKETFEFQEAKDVVMLDSKLTAAKRADLIAKHPDFAAILEDSKRIWSDRTAKWETPPANPDEERRRQELLITRNQVLNFVRDDIRRIYTEAASKPVASRGDSDSWYGSSATPKTLDDRLSDVREALGKEPKTETFNYKESFWDYGLTALRRVFGDINADRLQEIKLQYGGLASYAAAEVAIAIEKELRDQPLERGRFGDDLLLDIKRELEETRGEREKIRREERKRATAEERLHYNNWREKFDFTWAETEEELKDSIYDWLDFFEQQLPQEAEDKVYESINSGLHNVLGSLEQARNRLRIPAESVVARELRETLEGHVAIIGGARLLESRDGFEGFIKLRTDFATNYDGHTDSVYLKRGSAIMADQLSKNEGAIYKGGPEDLIKPLPGDTKAFRGELEQKAKKYAASHQLYITEDDFERAELGEREIVKEVSLLNLSLEVSRAIIKKRIEEKRKAGEKSGRYGWEDGIEELLLGDSRGLAKAQAETDPQKRAEAIAKIKARTGVFRGIKRMLDKEDGLAGKTPDERKNIIRQRIKDKITQEGNTVLLQEITALPDQVSQDRALWKWVKDFNKPRIELRREGSIDEPWFPSLWDMERLSIDKPEGLVDRVLSKNEFKAMVEEIEDPYKGLTNEQIQKQITIEFRRQAQGAVAAKHLSSQETASEVERMMMERQDVIRKRIGDVLFERKQREVEAERNYNLNKAHDKFLGLEARWGGLTTRVVGDDGKVRLRTVYSLAEEIIKAKIDREEREVEDKVNTWKQGYLTDHPGLTAEQIEEATTKQRRLFRRNATFAATLGLREIGIANNLPVWEYYYYSDVSQIGAFAPLVGYTEDDKGILPELLDRGRKEMEAVFHFMAEQHMAGKMLEVKDAPGHKIEDADGVQKDAHEEKWVRPRVINAGGVLKLRDLYEAQFMISTSGGVEVVDLIPEIANLGIFDELWENACKDKREWQGFRKRRNKWELRQQPFFNTREWAAPLTYVKRLAGASGARKFLVGGEVKGEGSVPGVLVEPMSGAYKYRDMFFNKETWLDYKSQQTVGQTLIPENISKIEQLLLNEENIKKLDPVQRDKLTEIGAGIMKPLIDYMDARKYVKNRAGNAPKNWKYDNEIIVEAYFDELLKRPDVGSDTLGGENLGYAIQGRSPIAVEIFREILKTSTYHILVEKDREALAPRVQKVKEAMDARRKALVATILPSSPADRKAMDDKGQELAKLNEDIEALKKEILKITLNNQNHAYQKGELDKKKANRDKVLEPEFIKLTNQTIEKELNAQFNAGNLSNESLRKKIIGRRQILAALNTTSVNIEREINRLINQYIDTKLHKEFVGEWPARLSSDLAA